MVTVTILTQHTVACCMTLKLKGWGGIHLLAGLRKKLYWWCSFHVRLSLFRRTMSQSNDCATPPCRKKDAVPKDHSEQTRVYDPDGYKLRVDAICFRDTYEKEVLLVSSRNWENQWTLPGGGIEPNETVEEAVLREAKEEAGVEGTISSFIGSFDTADNRTRTKVFTMVVTKELDHWLDKEKIGRERRWFTREEAITEIRMRKPWKSKWLEERKTDDSSTDRTISREAQTAHSKPI